ncbi:MAG: glycoside hydrolase family 3 N-terminal domain-containing protein [Ignavibacteriaceae bacterium]|jgi:beta-glucosidase|nr:glycoside hydrolase family 3 N-terminal domain-containing protein [Ignavibacteriaceae bacterium]
MKNFAFVFIMILLIACSQKGTESINESEFNDRVENLINKMTIDEKIGQMVQVDVLALTDENDLKNLAIGSVLSGGDSDPADISPTGWANLYDRLQSIALQSRLKIPIIYGIDAVHGNNNVYGAVIFPHNIGLGASGNEDLVRKVSEITAVEIAGTGIDWTFAPCVAVPRNEKWGRTYEGFGESPDLVKRLSAASVKGFQGINLNSATSVLACAKHYLGDGGTQNGIDQGNTILSEADMRQLHLQGYLSAINAGVGSIMVSYSSWNGQKMHGSKYWITDVLKNELGFEGFVVSDWAGIDQLPGDFKSDIENSINAGLDMIMLPNNHREFIKLFKQLVTEGRIKEDRINDAVRRILTIKFKMGLFERPLTDRALTAQIGSKEHREVARQAVRESLVLLKNDAKVLPLSKENKKILVIGSAADDIGMQCGGWTVTWQGNTGKVQPGTTILQAIKSSVSSSSKVTFSAEGNGAENADVIIAVIGETPYAEMKGDKNDLSISTKDANLISKVSASGKPIVTVLLSGRPMIIDKVLPKSNSFIAAWLPGTEGEGVADILFGDYSPKGKLSHSWPRTNNQIPINVGDANYDPLFAYGFGLTY